MKLYTMTIIVIHTFSNSMTAVILVINVSMFRLKVKIVHL